MTTMFVLLLGSLFHLWGDNKFRNLESESISEKIEKISNKKVETIEQLNENLLLVLNKVYDSNIINSEGENFFLFHLLPLIFIMIATFYTLFLLRKNRKKSHVLFTQESKKYKEKSDRKYRIEWLFFIISVIVALAVNLASSYIYEMIN